MLNNTIILPDWLDNKAVFQQNVPLVIKGQASSNATVALEIIKEPTDGKSVSRHDAEYGSIYNAETTTSSKGEFSFSIPPYKASSDAYTFVFTCRTETKKISDLRCGDVWIFLGADFISVPMCKSKAPATPLKRKAMDYMRFLSPVRSGINKDESNISFQPLEYYKDLKWISVTDTKELADIASSCFAFAYQLADQINYPVGIIDLAYEDSSTINWISRDSIEGIVALSDYLEDIGLNVNEETYNKIVATENNRKKARELDKKLKKQAENLDFDLIGEEKLKKLKNGETPVNDDKAVQEQLDFPNSIKSSLSKADSSDFSETQDECDLVIGDDSVNVKAPNKDSKDKEADKSDESVPLVKNNGGLSFVKTPEELKSEKLKSANIKNDQKNSEEIPEEVKVKDDVLEGKTSAIKTSNEVLNSNSVKTEEDKDKKETVVSNGSKDSQNIKAETSIASDKGDKSNSLKESGNSLKSSNKASANAPVSMARQLDFNSNFDFPIKEKKEEIPEIDDSEMIPANKRNSILFNAKLSPLTGIAIRGICYSFGKVDLEFERFDLLLMGLLDSLNQVIETQYIDDDKLMPSIFFVAMHPKNVNFANPYGVLKFNEELMLFNNKLSIDTSIISCHDLLLPDKTKSFTIGVRLATAALGTYFTEKLPKASPCCLGIEQAGNKLIATFDNLGDGLKLSEGETVLRGFSICGPDRVYYPAQAKILHGVRVMVWRDDVNEPVGVTYGFIPFPHEATFKNLAGLPVIPFRTDREPSAYSPDLSFTDCDKLEFIGKEKEDSEFEKLKIFRTIKGTGIISNDNLNKTSGEASINIKYETENSLYGFEPCLEYKSLLAPIVLYAKEYVLLDVFNPDDRVKKLTVSGFDGKAIIDKKLVWQTVKLPVWETPIKIEEFKIMIEDEEGAGEIYIDNIRFAK